MSTQRFGSHIPDILDCLAQLSNDEVPTPPKLARAMLDLLPEDVWTRPDFVWLDPFSKSGVFLREIASRLFDSLADWEPNFVKRREHILRNMLHGASITEMTGIISRRSLYCAADASSTHSVVMFDERSGNLPFIPAAHDFDANGKCRICRAPEDLERGDHRENYAYAFIHDAYPTKELANMKFDVIVGNPPYQLATDGHGVNASPIYQLFVERAIELDPRYALMITPSRWFAGGKGLDAYRARMIADRRLAKLVDNPKLFDCFPGVEIKGGVSYFLWDREHGGDCEFSTRVDGRILSTRARDLREGQGVVIRDNNVSTIIEKVGLHRGTFLSEVISPRYPFGAMYTNFADSEDSPFEDAVPLIYGSRVGYIRPDQVERNHEWVHKFKVLLPRAGDGHGREVSYVLGEPIALSPGSVCTQTYLVAGTFDTKTEAANYASYLTTKFVRFLVLQRKITQNVAADFFRFAPMLDMSQSWNDNELYDLFSLTQEERDYIEAVIHPREMNLTGLDSPNGVPTSHLPGGSKYRPGKVEDEPEDDE